MEYIVSYKEPDFVVKKENEFRLPFLVRRDEKQISRHCSQQTLDYLGFVSQIEH